MTDVEEQTDELLALESIYDEQIFTPIGISEAHLGDNDPGGQFRLCLELPQPFYVTTDGPNACQAEREVQHLPHLVLDFQYPPDYPSVCAPRFTLSCKWLPLDQLSRLCRHLDTLWEDNSGCVILYMWVTFLQEQTIPFLNITSPLKLSVIKITHNTSESLKAEDGTTYDVRGIQDVASQDLLLPAILDFDRQEINNRFRTSLFQCNVCFMDKLGEQCIRFDACKHVYCKMCMCKYFTVQIEDGNVRAMTCPDEKCDSQANPSQVRDLVPAEVFSRYDDMLLQTSLETMLDISHCPRQTCQCPVIIDQDTNMGQCPSCGYVFCVLCMLTYHGVSPCRIRSTELKKLRDQYLDADEDARVSLEKRYGRQTLKRAVEETFSSEWINQYSKACPKCGSNIQKIDGCNKMTCMRCHTYFCWLCMRLLPKNNPYTHFNDMSTGGCFNRLFEGVDLDEDEIPDFD